MIVLGVVVNDFLNVVVNRLRNVSRFPSLKDLSRNVGTDRRVCSCVREMRNENLIVIRQFRIFYSYTHRVIQTFRSHLFYESFVGAKSFLFGFIALHEDREFEVETSLKTLVDATSLVQTAPMRDLFDAFSVLGEQSNVKKNRKRIGHMRIRSVEMSEIRFQ